MRGSESPKQLFIIIRDSLFHFPGFYLHNRLMHNYGAVCLRAEWERLPLIHCVWEIIQFALVWVSCKESLLEEFKITGKLFYGFEKEQLHPSRG